MHIHFQLSNLPLDTVAVHDGMNYIGYIVAVRNKIQLNRQTTNAILGNPNYIAVDVSSIMSMSI